MRSRHLARAIGGAIAVPIVAGLSWLAWIYVTWAMQARTWGWVTALTIAALAAGMVAWRETK